MHSLRAILRASVLIQTMALFILGYTLSLVVRRHTTARAFRLRRRWVRFAIRVLGIHIDHKGSSPKEPCLYVCNHRSFSDPVIASVFVDAFVIAKAEVSDIPLIRKGAELTGVIYVKRQDKASRSATRLAMADTIQAGSNVLVYPEGTVGIDPHPLPFRKGTFIEAAKLGIPVVPMALEYRHVRDLWEKRGLIAQYFHQFGKARTECRFHIGPPIRDEDGLALCERVEAWVRNETRAMQEDWSYAFPSA